MPKSSSCANWGGEIHSKSLLNRPKITPKSVAGAPWEPLASLRASQSAQDRSKRRPKKPRGRPWARPGPPQERPRHPKELPRSARELPREASGGAKSIPRRSPERKSSILSKVLRAPPLPTRGALRSSPDHPEITPESLQIGAPTPSRGLLDRLCSLEGDSGALDDRSRSTQAASGRRPRPPRAPRANPVPRGSEALARNIE